jgi:hypothetical protein
MGVKTTIKNYIIVTACIIAVLTQMFLEIIISVCKWLNDEIPNILEILFFDCLGWERNENYILKDNEGCKDDDKNVDSEDNT